MSIFRPGGLERDYDMPFTSYNNNCCMKFSSGIAGYACPTVHLLGKKGQIHKGVYIMGENEIMSIFPRCMLLTGFTQYNIDFDTFPKP